MDVDERSVFYNFTFNVIFCRNNIYWMARGLLCGQGFVTPKGISQYVVVVYFKCILPSSCYVVVVHQHIKTKREVLHSH